VVVVALLITVELRVQQLLVAALAQEQLKAQTELQILVAGVVAQATLLAQAQVVVLE
jgi:hypothetical protein